MNRLREKMTATLLTILFVASLVTIPVQASDGNLVVNGDFETPVVPPGKAWEIYDSGTPGLGWTV